MAAVNVPQLVPGAGRPHLVLVTDRPRRRPVRPDPATIARRRLVVLAAAVLLLCAALVLVQRLGTAGVPAGDGGFTAERIGQAVHVVQPGETLWDIAEQLAPDADPRVVVALLVEHNGEEPLQVGQRLVLP